MIKNNDQDCSHPANITLIIINALLSYISLVILLTSGSVAKQHCSLFFSDYIFYISVITNAAQACAARSAARGVAARERASGRVEDARKRACRCSGASARACALSRGRRVPSVHVQSVVHGMLGTFLYMM